jgi:hypothetical protein
VLIKLSDRTSTPPSSNTIIPSTPKNKEEYVTMLNNINPQTRDYPLILSKTMKAAAILFADRHLLQETNRSLFKTNMRKQKERNTKVKNARLSTAFGRVLTPAQATKMRKEAIEKEIALTKKKEDMKVRRKERAEEKEKAMKMKRQKQLKIAQTKEKKMKIKRQKQLKMIEAKETKKLMMIEIKKQKQLDAEMKKETKLRKQKEKMIEMERKRAETTKKRSNKRRNDDQNEDDDQNDVDEMVSKRLRRR